MMIIEFRRLTNGIIQGIIPFNTAGVLGVEPGDEIDFTLKDEHLFIYRLDPLGVRFGSGFKVVKSGSTKGYSLFSAKMNPYINGGDVFEIDEEQVFDELSGVDLYSMERT
tara:strand:+ start:293 stop:622 length:330 start_codon:yes stop_codon:yes gene_type:complete